MSRSISVMTAGIFFAGASIAIAQPVSSSHRHHALSGSSSPVTTARDMGNAGSISNQFASESEAKSHCAGDTVVWVNTKTHVYHFLGNAAYGHTKRGAYMCRADADRGGSFRAAKNEKALSAK